MSLSPEYPRNNIIELSPEREVSMGGQWYSFAVLTHFWISWRFLAMAKYQKLFPPRDESVLEIGCGSGAFRMQLEKELGFCADGCDLNREALSLIPEGRGDIFLYDITEQREELKEKYSALFLMDVLEHIEDDVSFLKSAAFHARTGASIVINVPASPYLFSRYDEVIGHHRRYTKQTLREVLKAADLEEQVVTYWGFSLLPPLLIRNMRAKFANEHNVVEKGFEPPSEILNQLLHIFKKLELFLPLQMPFGTSLLAIAKKR